MARGFENGRLQHLRSEMQFSKVSLAWCECVDTSHEVGLGMDGFSLDLNDVIGSVFSLT